MTDLTNCPLCQSKNHSLFHKDQNREYFRCSVCSYVFVPNQFHLSESEEKLRYDTHNNDPQDSRYRQFLSQLIEPLQELIPDQSIGLDFGSGPGPTLSLMLIALICLLFYRVSSFLIVVEGGDSLKFW